MRSSSFYTGQSTFSVLLSDILIECYVLRVSGSPATPVPTLSIYSVDPRISSWILVARLDLDHGVVSEINFAHLAEDHVVFWYDGHFVAWNWTGNTAVKWKGENSIANDAPVRFFG